MQESLLTQGVIKRWPDEAGSMHGLRVAGCEGDGCRV